MEKFEHFVINQLSDKSQLENTISGKTTACKKKWFDKVMNGCEVQAYIINVVYHVMIAAGGNDTTAWREYYSKWWSNLVYSQTL